jgi:hypothetical protein
MRGTMAMLTILSLSGCGQPDDVEGKRSGGAPAAGVTEVKEVSSPLRFGRRHGNVSGRVRRTLAAAADRLSDLQADRIGDNARNGLADDDPDDGGWDFTLASSVTSHSPTPSPENTYGATAIGPWTAFQSGSDTARTRTTLLGAGLGAQERPEIDSPQDFVYLTLLSDVADDPAFTDLARARYDAKVTAAGGARALAEDDRDFRHAGGNDGLILYDLAWYTLGAIALDGAFPGVGYDADAGVYAGVAVSDITSSAPFFDVEDANERFYYQGLAWSLVVLTRDGSAPELLARVRDILRDAQAANGSWGFNAATPTDDLQSTAHVVQALSITAGDRREDRAEARRGAAWILPLQAANGGWEYAPGQESTLVDAEAMLALYLQQLSPSAAALTASDIGQSTEPLTLRSVAQGGRDLAAPTR